METIFMNTEDSKTNEPHRFVLNLSQRLDLRRSNKHIALLHLSIYYTWKKIRQQYKTINSIAPKCNDKFELPDVSYSVSDIQDYIEYIIKNMKHCLLIFLFIFTSAGLAFKIKDAYKHLKP